MNHKTDNHVDARCEGPSSRQTLIKELLLDALDVSVDQRIAFVESRTVGDDVLRSDLMTLLDDYERAGEFMSGSPAIEPDALRHPDDSPLEEPGTQIGRYRLVRLLGEGGFGRVYLAEQDDSITRSVALKIIKAGMDTRQVIARFEAERQVLARMDHPGIARVIDAGAAPAGRPYFVMELVDGVPINSYCDEHHLSISERLDLFSQVCAAVQHAHTKGIIHRDIKPANILVGDGTKTDEESKRLRDEGVPSAASSLRLAATSSHPRPKVIDFGIAKAVSGRLTAQTLATERLQLVGTPEYMSPEQADSYVADIDTRTDVYSLGIVLYELLTGVTPLDADRVRTASLGQVQRMICEEEPMRPSTKLSASSALSRVAANRAADPGRLVSQIKGDLDWIVLKAVEKDRERRYGSAADLARDLERCLRHEPVLAGPQSVSYRVRKFVRRNRASVFAATFIMLALLGGVFGTATGLLRAQDSARQAGIAAEEAKNAAEQSAAINEFMREFLTSVDPDQRGADVGLAEVLDEASAAAGDRFAGHPELEAEVRRLLGDVYMRLTLVTKAETEFRKAVELMQRFAGADDPRTLDAMIGVGLCLVTRERPRELESYFAGLTPKLVQTFGPTDRRTLQAIGLIAEAQRMRGRHDESERMLRDALLTAQAGGADNLARLWLMNTLTGTLRAKLEVVGTESRSTAIDDYRTSALQLLELGLTEGRQGRWFVRAARLNLADIALLQGEYASAASQCQTVIDETQGMLGDCHMSRISAMYVLAQSVNRLGDPQRAADHLLRVVECSRVSYGGDSLRVMAFLSDVLPYLHRAERWQDGERCAREVIQIVEGFGGAHVSATRYKAMLAHFITQQDRLDEAKAILEPMLQNSLADLDDVDRLVLLSAEMNYLIHRGEYEHAEQRLREIEQVFASRGLDVRLGIMPEHPEEIVSLGMALYRAWNKPDEASRYEQMYEESVRMTTAPTR